MSRVVARSADRIVRPVQLRPTDHGRQMSLEEFEHASGQEGYQYELINGRVEVSPEPEFPHDRLLEWVRESINDYRKANPAEINYVSTHSRMHLPGRRPATCPEPDVAAYRGVPLHLPSSFINWRLIHPILVVEVISEDTPSKDVLRNVKLYLQVPSIREYWIVDPRPDPDQPMLTVYRRRGKRWQKPIVVPFGGKYETKLLPGFSLLVDPNKS